MQHLSFRLSQKSKRCCCTDGALPVLSLLNRARKERVQRHLDAKPELAAAAEASKRYTGILNKQP